MSAIEKTGMLRRDILQGTAIAGLAALRPTKALAAAPSETDEAIAPQPTPGPSNDLNTSDILIETLIDWGATHVFGIVGDGINSIIEALRPLPRGGRLCTGCDPGACGRLRTAAVVWMPRLAGDGLAKDRGLDLAQLGGRIKPPCARADVGDR
jgi:hypothetical protein